MSTQRAAGTPVPTASVVPSTSVRPLHRFISQAGVGAAPEPTTKLPTAAMSTAERLLAEAQVLFERIGGDGSSSPAPAPSTSSSTSSSSSSSAAGVDQQQTKKGRRGRKRASTEEEDSPPPPATRTKRQRRRRGAKDEEEQEDEVDLAEPVLPEKPRKKRKNGRRNMAPMPKADFFAGTHVCTGHLRNDCAECNMRVPVLVKYGLRFVKDWVQRTGCICLYPSRDTGEPCSMRFGMQRKLFDHAMEHYETEEAVKRGKTVPDPLTKQRRYKVSQAVIKRLMDQYEENDIPDAANLATIIAEESRRLQYSKECEPCPELVIQRYRWELMKISLCTPMVRQDKTRRRLRSIYFSIVDQLMFEDTPLKYIDTERILLRLACQYNAHRHQRQKYKVTIYKRASLSCMLGWVLKVIAPGAPRIAAKDLKSHALPLLAEKRKVEDVQVETPRAEQVKKAKTSKTRRKSASDSSEDSISEEETESDASNAGASEEYEPGQPPEQCSPPVPSSDARGQSGTNSVSLPMPQPSRTNSTITPTTRKVTAHNPMPVSRELLLARRREIMRELDALLAVLSPDDQETQAQPVNT